MFRNRFFLFGALLFFSLIIMSFQAKAGPINPFGFLSYPLNAINHLVHQSVTAIKRPFSMIVVAFGENEQLKEEVKELRLDLQQLEEMRAENKRLKELMGLRSTQPSFIAYAQLINKGADNWFKTMIIDKGEESGVQKDMIVIVPGGLTGKIIRVWPSYAEMLLITDSSYSVSVRLQNSRVEGILTGTGGNYCLLNYISNDVEVEEGDVLVSSGLDKYTPKGIPVGMVRHVRKTTPELFQYIEVEPFVDTSRIEEVMIIKQ
jgi:rod shape-determining protein MreC